MFRKFLLTSVTALGLVAPAAMPASAEAGEFRLEISRSKGHYGGYGYGARPYYDSYSSRPYYGAASDYSYRRLPEPVGYLPAARTKHYHVMYRRCDHEPWREYGAYNCHEMAHEIEEGLVCRGYEARVVHH
jgi:hypothetical protein